MLWSAARKRSLEDKRETWHQYSKAVIQRHEYAACEANKNMVSLFLKLQWEISYAYSACEAIGNKVSMFLKLQWERGTQGL